MKKKISKKLSEHFKQQRDFVQIIRDKLGRFKKLKQVKLVCKNHPNRKAHSKFMCRSCYDKELRLKNEEYDKKIKKYQKEYGKKNYEKLKKYNKKYCEQESQYTKRNRYLKRKYGITVEQYNKMFKKQQGKCSICNKKFKATLHVDHDHKTGKIRGLLCFRCNYGIGYFKDDLKTFKRIVKYLKGV